jgi:hypothetical protein
MSAKTIFAAALVVTVLGFATARGQTPYPMNGPADSASMPASAAPDNGPSSPPANGPSPPVWANGRPEPPPYVTYQRADCCGPVGGDGPILDELFMRAGISLPVSGKIFGHTLETGWMLTGGGRTLFYDPDMKSAWAVEIGVTNIRNHGQRSDIRVPLSIFVPDQFGTATRVNFGRDPGVPGVTIKNLNRTSADLALGRECYLMGSAKDPCTKWRVGIDGGVRYGSERVEFQEIKHRVGVFETGFVALHSDVECPCCTVIFLAGFRIEWDYTSANVLQRQNDSDVMDVNFLFTTGIRF